MSEGTNSFHEQKLTQRTGQIDDIFMTKNDDKMFQEVLELIVEATESRHGAVGYMDTDGSVVVPALSKEVWMACRIPFTTHRFPPGSWSGIWIPALVDGRAHYSNERKPVPMGHVSIERCLIAPVIYQGKVIGHFELANKDTDYNDDDLQFLMALADHTSPLLHARLKKMRGED